MSTDSNKPIAVVVEETTAIAQSEERLAEAAEMRRVLMKRIAIGGFVAPAVLSTLLNQAAAFSVIVAPDQPN